MQNTHTHKSCRRDVGSGRLGRNKENTYSRQESARSVAADPDNLLNRLYGHHI